MSQQLADSATCAQTSPDDPEACHQYYVDKRDMEHEESTKLYGACPPKHQPHLPYQRAPPLASNSPCDDVVKRDVAKPDVVKQDLRKRSEAVLAHAECCVTGYKQRVYEIQKAPLCRRCDDPANVCENPTVNKYASPSAKQTCTKTYDADTCMLASPPPSEEERQKKVTFAAEVGDEARTTDDAAKMTQRQQKAREEYAEFVREQEAVCPSLVHRGTAMVGPHPKCDTNGSPPVPAAPAPAPVEPEEDDEPKEPEYPWRFPTEEYKSACGHGVPKKAIRNIRALEQEGVCPIIPFVKPGEPKTSDYYKTCRLPSRFEYPSCFSNFGCQMRPVEHPFYRTTTKDYGWYAPNVHSVPSTFMPRSQTFTKAQSVGGMYRNYGLNLLS